MIQKKFCYH